MRWHPGAQLELAELLLGQRRARERVVLTALDHRPAQARELAGGRDDRDLHPPTRADALEERAQRTRGLDRDPRGLDQHPASVRASLLGDPPMRRGLTAGLLDPRVQTEIRHELLGLAEAAEVPDRGDDRQRDRRVNARDRHQPLHLAAAQRDPAELGVDDPQLLRVEVELAQQRSDGELLIGRQRLASQPHATLDPEQVRRRATRDQVAMQDRLHLILQPRALPDDVRPARDLPTQRLGRLISDPHRRQIVGRQQLAEHLRVDLVGLDLRLGDRPRLLRVRYHHPLHARLDQPHDRVRVARRLDSDLVLGSEAVRERAQRLRGQRELPGLANSAVLPHRDLRELAMHIQSDTPASHHDLPTIGLMTMGVRRANDTYGSALEAHPG